MRKINSIGWLAAMALTCGSAHAFTITNFQAQLDGGQEVPPNASKGSGTVTFTFDSDTNVLSIVEGNYADLGTAVTASHVHGPAPVGVNAGVIFAITNTGGTAGTLTGSGALSPAHVTALFDDMLYVNVHTSGFPGGEIRGQIYEVPAKKPTQVDVIYTEIPGSPTAVAPGMKDLAGNPIAPLFTALFDFAISHDGTQWILRADTDADTTFDQVLLLGSGANGPAATPLAQDGQPVPGTLTNELWDFFDSDYPASFNAGGDIAFSGRARPSTSIKEKIIRVVNGTPELVATESTPILGLVDVPANPQGDELIGNSVGSVSLLNNGQIFFGNTPIQNCHSTRYPALMLAGGPEQGGPDQINAFAQSGITPLNPPNDNEIWDNFGFGDCGMAADGLNWFALGDTENPNTALDRIFAINNNKIVQENTEIGATGVIAADIFFVHMSSNGNWFARGDDTAPDNDWALVGNGTSFNLVAKTGTAITPGSSENWGAVFSAFNGNNNGDWVLAGNTDNPDTNIDNVLVLNGTEVILREGDPVDIDGNGKFDDDAFLGGTLVTSSAFTANDVFITDDGVIYVIAIMRSGANVSLGDVLLRVGGDKVPVCEPDIAPPGGDGTVNVDDLLLVINSWGDCPKGEDCPADITGDGTVNVDDLLAVINAWGDC